MSSFQNTRNKPCNTRQDLSKYLGCSSRAARIISAVSDCMCHSHHALVHQCCTLISSVFLLWSLSRQALVICQDTPCSSCNVTREACRERRLNCMSIQLCMGLQQSALGSQAWGLHGCPHKFHLKKIQKGSTLQDSVHVACAF